MRKIKITTIIAISFVVVLVFYILNILVLFFLLNIAAIISKSYQNIAKTSQDKYMTIYKQEKPWKQAMEIPERSWSFSCDTAHFEYDLCYLNRETVVDPTNGIVSVVDLTGMTPPSITYIRPYPRKGHIDAMSKTKEITITTSPLNVQCTVTHHSAVIIFSAGGFTGNTFHDFNEGWVPLFVTVYEFFKDRDVILGIYDCKDWWLVRYAELFPYFTLHPIINLDKDQAVHCFPYGIVGLKSHGVMEVEPAFFETNPKTMLDFHAIFAKAYNRPALENADSTVLPTFSSGVKPKLAFLVRKDTRKVVNKGNVVRAAKEAGFEVVVFEITKKTPMQEIYKLINNSHVFMSVHGAALTHLLFLQPGSILLQIIPINCGWIADMCYGKLALRLGIKHIAYEIGFNESSLKTDEFARNAILDRLNPASSMMGNIDYWNKYMNQDIDLDVVRFKRYLERAYEKARYFMQIQG